MRKWILGVGVLALVVASTFVAAPAGATHGGDAEGTITVAGVSVCSEMNDPASGICNWDSTDENGWIGTGPFKITYDPDKGGPLPSVTAVDCPAGAFCQTSDLGSAPIPGGAAVTANGSGGGTFAAGDADTTDTP